MLEFMVTSVPSALRAACISLAELSFICMACFVQEWQLFYYNKLLVLPWNNVNLHLNCFLRGKFFPELLFLPIFNKFMLIYEPVSECLTHACGMWYWSEVSGTC